MAESYVDHALVLSERERYRSLFDLDPKDYKGWARGLKAAGYATNPAYADLLIRIIEENNLQRFDNALLADYVTPVVEQQSMMASMSWLPMVNTGLREVMGSWKMIEILLPRILAISFLSAPTSS